MLEPGVIVAGDFRIDGVLGEGGMGVVYEATQLVFERTVALKLIATALTEDDDFRERFRREGRLQARLEHPHIIDVYAAGPSEYGLYLAMRLVRGPSLSDLIGTPSLSVDRVVRLLSQVASALDAAHDVGLIHRDIKPHNILIDQRRDHSYLADFGVTKALGAPGLTHVGQRVGTLTYMAPEQFRGYESTERSDIYSFGVVVYECFVGTVPYPFPTEASIINAHLSEPVPAITKHRPELPPALDEVIFKAMAKDPDDRYSSGSELMDDVARAVGRTPFVLPTVASTPETQLSPVIDPTPPPGTRDTTLSAADETDEPAERSSTPAPATFSSPEPVSAAEASALAAVAEPSHSPPPDEPRPQSHPTKLTPEPGVSDSTPLAAPTVRPVGGVAPKIQDPTPSEQATQRAKAAPPQRPRRLPVSLAGLTVTAAVAVLLLGAVGFFVGRSNAPAHRRTVTYATARLVQSGDVTVSAPLAWRKQVSAPTIPGLSLRSPLALAPSADPHSGGLVAGTVARSWPTFLPASFRSAVGESGVRRRTIVRLGELSAFRYLRLKPRGFDGIVTLYVVPQAGIATIVACYGTASAPALSKCDSIAASLKLANAQRYELVPSTRYAAVLNGAMRRLQAARKDGLRTLAAATTQKQQAAAAGAIAAAYSRAALASRRDSPTEYIRPAHVRILAALRAAQSSYSLLAQAARSGSRSRYDAARRRIRAREAQLRAELARLRTLGFKS